MTTKTIDDFDLKKPRGRRHALMALCRVSPSYATQIIKGDRRPSLRLALKIYRKTGLKYGLAQVEKVFNGGESHDAQQLLGRPDAS